MPPRRIVIVSAGLGQPSSTRLLADRLGLVVERSLGERGVEAELQVVELRDLGQDLINNLLTGFPSPTLQAAIDAVATADGVIAVTPIYSASYSGLFKLFFDVLERGGLAGRPVLIAATAGTPRHSLALEHALRPLFAYFGAAVVPTAVFAATDDWGTAQTTVDASLAQRIERAGRELAAAVAARNPGAPADRFTDPVPFDRLLAGD